MVFQQRLGESQTVHVMGYTGNRKVMQVLGIPTGPQLAATHSGGVIDLDTDYRGVDLRWSAQGELAGRAFELTVGLNADEQSQLRRGYQNFIGTTLGVRGALRRDETDDASNSDQFAQFWWQFAPRWSMLAGVRRSDVHFRATDRYIVLPGNGDDSGARRYASTMPVAGLMFRPSSSLRLYVSAGQGFETPTLNEISYRANGQPVAILKNSALVGYLVPAEAVDQTEHRVATLEEVMEILESSRARVQPVLDYLRDK